MVSERDGPASQHILSQGQRVRKKVYINETEPVITGSNHLSIRWLFLLQYFKSRKTTYMTYFFCMSIDQSLMAHSKSVSNTWFFIIWNVANKGDSLIILLLVISVEMVEGVWRSPIVLLIMMLKLNSNRRIVLHQSKTHSIQVFHTKKTKGYI